MYNKLQNHNNNINNLILLSLLIKIKHKYNIFMKKVNLNK